MEFKYPDFSKVFERLKAIEKSIEESVNKPISDEEIEFMDFVEKHCNIIFLKDYE